jgi:ATP-dependent exoDNAse (exonuclease V) beta subunit
MSDGRQPPDQAGRDRIRTDLGSTLFVSAGAGSGKTATLVDRVVALVVTGTAELERVAAVTFTDKAASELRDRVRETLERVATSGDALTAGRCRVALDQLDRSPIGTLHSFAQRILSEHPIEAGLPPRVEVLDEVSSGIEFEQRWRPFFEKLLADPDMERTVLLLLAGGIGESVARALARAFEDNWDRVENNVPTHCPEPPHARQLIVPVLAEAEEVCALSRHCTDVDDLLLGRLQQIAGHIDELRAAGDEVDLLDKLDRIQQAFRSGNKGRKGSWNCPVDDVRAQVKRVGERLAEVRSEVLQACAHKLGTAIRSFTLESARQRKCDGRLAFHDLLVLARSLLCDPVHGPAVRAAMAARFDRLLLDEFQDTDPIQIELAVRIAAADPLSASADQWEDVEVSPGRLFLVGDPKQSIYRFRRADVATFLRAGQRFEAGRIGLNANFRTVAPVLDWVNHTFARLFDLPVDTDTDMPSQPEYEPLVATRIEPPPKGPAVSILGRVEADGDSADTLRAREAETVADTVVGIISEGWSVGIGPGGSGGWRPAHASDVTILVPARTSLPYLEDALEAREIAFRAESSSLVYATRAVRDLLVVVRAIDDPTDHLRVVGALRTPLLACGNDDLWRYRVERGGHWDYLRHQPDTVPPGDPVAAGLDFLHRMHLARTWMAPSEILDGVARQRRVFELGHATGRPRDVWRRIRYVIDQARAWSEATSGTLRQYLAWVDLQATDSARISEPILPESDHEAVRIMTIHAAKGLEFPITILSGMSTRPGGRFSPVEVRFLPQGGVGYHLGAKIATPEFVDRKPIDEQMALDERIRLLYVAATRARDHLVVSCFRNARSATASTKSKLTNAELMIEGIGDRLDDLPDGDGAPPSGGGGGGAGHDDRSGGHDGRGWARAGRIGATLIPRHEWETELATVLVRANRPNTVAATALTAEGQPDPAVDVRLSGSAELDFDRSPDRPDPGLQKRPRDQDLPPWLKGRYGTSVGRAVHAVLQTIDLSTGAGQQAAVAAQCEAEAIPEHVGHVSGLVAHALSSGVVREAARSPHWREVYVCVPAPGGRLLEGYIDLLYRRPDGLVVVDYKTASTDDSAELDRRVEGYRAQGASYAMAVETATGEGVVRVTFLFLTPSGPVERDLDDVGPTIASLKDRIEVGTETVVS